ncbi:hypothetical protein, partial [Bacteroides pyogenes]|uniref:hypothetical protein n=1 Tax=Bacteroides pyogenes TaxID=310300 RepID=UPI001F2FDE25
MKSINRRPIGFILCGHGKKLLFARQSKEKQIEVSPSFHAEGRKTTPSAKKQKKAIEISCSFHAEEKKNQSEET